MKDLQHLLCSGLKIGASILIAFNLTGCNAKSAKPIPDKLQVEEVLKPRLEDPIPPKKPVKDSPIIEILEPKKFYINCLGRAEFTRDTPLIDAIIKDINGKEYDFSYVYADYHTIIGNKAITIHDKGVYYLCDLQKIKKIERKQNSEETTVDLKTGEQIKGEWFPNYFLGSFYHRHNPERKHILGLYNQTPHKIKIENIKQITFGEIKYNEKAPEIDPADKVKVFPDPKGEPKKIELIDKRIFTTSNGYVIDFCGHHSYESQHYRLEDYCWTMNSFVKLKELEEIVFTGEFDKENEQCRNIILKYKDGRKEKDSLYLTSQSFSGTCNHESAFRNIDGVFTIQDYGAAFIRLDSVKKIIPLPAEENILPQNQ